MATVASPDYGLPYEQVLELADRIEDYLGVFIADLGLSRRTRRHPGDETTEGELPPAQTEENKHLSGIHSAVERCIAQLKNWKILATGYRRPLRKLAPCLAAVTALEFYASVAFASGERCVWCDGIAAWGNVIVGEREWCERVA